MTIVRMHDHELPDGNIDWKAYHEAQVRNGERCYDCNQPTLGILNLGSPRQCTSCRIMSKSVDDVDHERLIRCPDCKHRFLADDCYDDGMYQEGTASVQCPLCDLTFDVEVEVSFTYVSPKLRESQDDE